MSSERPNQEFPNHHKKHLLIHGQSPVLVNNGRLQKQIKYLQLEIRIMFFW